MINHTNNILLKIKYLEIMDLQTTKLELMKMIININSQKTIDNLLNFLKSESSDFWLQLSDSEKEEINLGIEQLELGQRIPAEQVFANIL